MTAQSRWVPPGIDPDTPSAARVYDFYLGGANNFEVDRELANRVQAALPDIKHTARANRAFLMRAVRWCATAGVDQFLDLGCGLPTAGAVHQVAQSVNPKARVVYVDNEPVAVAHSEMLLQGVPGTAVIQADLRFPETFLDHDVTRELLNFGRPVAVLLSAVLHFVQDSDNPARIVAGLRDALVPDSLVVVSHGTGDGDDAAIEDARRLYDRSQNPAAVRTRAEVVALMRGFDLVSPGVVWVPEWHPDPMTDQSYPPARSHMYGVVGRVR